jgi:hypothetical protein
MGCWGQGQAGAERATRRRQGELVWYVTAYGFDHAVRSGLALGALRRLDEARGVARRLLALTPNPSPAPRERGGERSEPG